MELSERIDAYVDGELDDARRAAFEAEMSASPTLADQVARRRSLTARLHAAYDPVLSEEIPLRLAIAASAANDGPRSALAWVQAGTIAASLLLGVFLGRLALPAGPFESRNGALTAQGALAEALTSRLAADQGSIRVGLSFRDTSGAWCRTFQSTPDRLAGLACHDHGRWVAHAVAAWTPAQNPYRTASADLPPSILAAVDATAAHAPVDALAERAARDAGWR